VTDKEITRKSETPIPLVPDRPISLRVAGADLLLSGRFDHWRPVSVSGWEDGQASAALLFDATATSGAAPTRRNPDLLSFASKTVEQVGEHSYRAHGTLRADGAQRTVDAVIQTPSGHSPFFFLTLGLERQAFAGLWTELQVLASQPHEGEEDGHEMRPRAWLRLPVLAAA
jgi:hypothetical protein